MTVLNKDHNTHIASYTGYSKTKRYRVNIQSIQPSKDIVYTYCAEMVDLRAIVDSYIEDLSSEEDFKIFVKLNQESVDGSSTVDAAVTVTYEETNHLFYPPEPVSFETEKGTYSIEARAEFKMQRAFTAVLNYEDYPIRIIELINSLITGSGYDSINMPILILLICYDPETDMYEAFPLSISVCLYPKEEDRLPDGDLEKKERILQFRNFVDSLIEQGELMSEKITIKK